MAVVFLSRRSVRGAPWRYFCIPLLYSNELVWHRLAGCRMVGFMIDARAVAIVVSLILSAFATMPVFGAEPLVIYGDDNIPPYEFIDGNQPKGLNADLRREAQVQAGAVISEWEIRLGVFAGIAFILAVLLGLAFLLSQRKALAAFAESEQKLRDLGNAMPQLMWTADHAGNVNFCNERAKEYDGLIKNPDGNWSWTAVLLPEDLEMTMAAWGRAFECGSPYQVEHRIRCAGGSYRWHISRAVPIRGNDGAVVRWYGTSTDVDELKVAKSEAEAANSAKSRFLASASHDLRQPAQALMLLTAMLAARVKDDGTRTIVEHIDRATMALKVLLDGLLDISRLDAGIVEVTMRPVHLGDLLTTLNGEYGVQAVERGLTLGIVPSGMWVNTDPALLERILRNLIDNALKYTMSGRVLIGCRRQCRHVRIDVYDTGIGIGAEQLDTIFQEFYQVDNSERDRSKGLGLGLAIVQRTAQLIGANVGARSVPGKGSCFSVLVPHALADLGQNCSV